MSTTSTVVAVRKQLVTQLTAAPGLAGVQISYAYRGTQKTAKEAIWCGFARDASVEIASLKAGRKRRDETYVQDLVVEVFKDGATQQDTDDRALALFAEVDGILADDPQLGFVAGEIHWAVMSGWDQVSGSTDTGHACRFEIDITVKARLS